MIVVSDTTLLISILKIKRLDLLERLFGQVIIPQEGIISQKHYRILLDKLKE